MNRKQLTIPLALLTALSLSACQEEATAPLADVAQPAYTLGNGYPVPSHDYQLMIIGVPKDKTATMDNNSGHRIFVQLYSDNTVTSPGGKNPSLAKGGGDDQNHIYLCNSTDGLNDVNDARCEAWRLAHPGEFGVIDANGTDGDGAIFGLPDPCADADITTACTPTYRIWARALAGKGEVTITTCADETGSGFDGVDDVWCGANGITLSKQTAFKAIEVTNSLLSMTILVNDATDPQLAACIGGPGATDADADWYTVYLFDNCFENYFWNYDNNGLKVLQLRFYDANSLL